MLRRYGKRFFSPLAIGNRSLAYGTARIANGDGWPTSAKIGRQFSLCEFFGKFVEAETRGFPRVSKPKRTETASRPKPADFVAEGVGFEPTVPSRAQRFSRPP